MLFVVRDVVLAARNEVSADLIVLVVQFDELGIQSSRYRGQIHSQSSLQVAQGLQGVQAPVQQGENESDDDLNIDVAEWQEDTGQLFSFVLANVWQVCNDCHEVKITAGVDSSRRETLRKVGCRVRTGGR